MEIFLAILLGLVVGVIIGLVAPIQFWRKRLYRLDLTWRINCATVINQTIADLFGGHVQDGVIHIPDGEGTPHNEDPEKGRPN